MVYAILGFGLFAVWGALCFAAGVRVGKRRATTIQFVRPGSAFTGNTVARAPQQPAAPYEPPTWSQRDQAT